ncbi:hypothetical protein [Craterilacuibacter sinensis]|nr:hypothetical protein [Craterilacuibacter sinensis]
MFWSGHGEGGECHVCCPVAMMVQSCLAQLRQALMVLCWFPL